MLKHVRFGAEKCPAADIHLVLDRGQMLTKSLSRGEFCREMSASEVAVEITQVVALPASQ